MRYQTIIRLLAALAIYAGLVGCPKQLVQPGSSRNDARASVPEGQVAEPQPAQSAPAAGELEESESMDFQPAPISQLHAAMLGLESFRVFGYHSKIQNDNSTLQSLKEPTFEYIREKIDPHLMLKKIKYDPAHQIYIASFLYLKAYLYWIHNDIDSSRKTIAVLNRTFPHKHRDITIHLTDKGDIALDEALYELEAMIGPKPN